MAEQTYTNAGPIYTTAAKYEELRAAGTLETGREYKIVDWEAQQKLTAGSNITINGNTIAATDTVYTAGNGIQITNNEISIDGINGIAIYDTRIDDANDWLTNGYTKTHATSEEEYEVGTLNLPPVCTDSSLWGVLLYVAENNENKAGLQQYFPIDGDYKGRVFYRSVTGWGAGIDPEFGDWNIVPWSSEKQDVLTFDSTPTAASANPVTSAGIATALDDKISLLGNVDDPTDPGYGYPYNFPYDVIITPSEDKLTIGLKTITLENHKYKNVFNKELSAATESSIGLMTAADAKAVRTDLPAAIASITTLQAMDDSWCGNNLTTAEAAEKMFAEGVQAGEGYLGEVSWSDLSTLGLGNAEVKAFVISGDIIQFEMTSSDTSPYAWFFNSAAGVWRSYYPSLDTLPGYSANKTQVLKNDNGTIKWVDE